MSFTSTLSEGSSARQHFAVQILVMSSLRFLSGHPSILSYDWYAHIMTVPIKNTHIEACSDFHLDVPPVSCHPCLM